MKEELFSKTTPPVNTGKNKDNMILSCSLLFVFTAQ